VYRVQHHHGIYALQRPVLPFTDDGQNLVRNLGHSRRVHLDSVQLLHRAFDIPRRRSLRIQKNDFVLDVRDIHLVLLYDLRFVFAVPIARHRQLHIALAAGNSFLVAAVPAVVRLLVPVVVLAVPEVAFKFRVHAFLNQAGG